jgi:cyanophycinase-like exopeptidase
MKDHKFTVPLVLNEKEIIINGIAEEKTTSVEMLQHYAEDAGRTKAEIAAIKDPKKEIVIVAKGILVN